MRGFVRRFTVEQAWAWIDEAAGRLPAESVPLSQSAGRVLAEDAMSLVDVPGFDRAMMDGFAVRAEETQGAGQYNPIVLRVVGRAMPGRACETPVGPGQAVRIMTGSPMPADANAVLPAEMCEFDDRRVTVLADVSPGKHVGRQGEDIAHGTRALAAGRVLRPQDLGVLSSIGVANPSVIRRPRVRIIATGRELLPAGSAATGYSTVDANSPMLSALVMRDGGLPLLGPIVPDDPAEVLRAMQTDADIVLISGGSSVGDEDHAPRILAEQGELAIHGIAMRPSSPAGMGRLASKLVFLLPGNPVSCLCAYDFFAGRAIRLLGGRPKSWPYRAQTLPMRRKVSSVVGRLDYCRVAIGPDGLVEPLAIGGAAVLSSTTRADGFILIPADSEGYGAGTVVEVFRYE